ncbi:MULTISPECIES: type II toxin-antitoxin system Phd/YefM family antitoxin [Moraxella]|uniref:Antitoxin n=1 Tax=Moraxella porci DSM 25326 TaxID=573983 RepID=A0A1T0CRH2_9GAMM|nr:MULTISPECIES: type II toxin-antitoxin system Phd/YefM family antitoxin [Moraxella]MDH2273234.1 type II toxin-antitoxin system Phd/YefM family antitoxin [Moraxella porci]OOS24927.1 plasmid stabilization protein [Moraxella porci DSM 25326]PNP98259.1 plasmid stabilization protein [Moraxella sp. RCAD0137]
MLNTIHSKYIASISEFKKSPMDALKIANGEAVAVLNRNEPAFYCVPAALYENMLDLIEDLELSQIAEERRNEPRIRVNIDEL